MDRSENRFMTPTEVAEALRVSNDTVLRLIASGELPALRVSPRILRIPTPAFAVFQSGLIPARRSVVRRRRTAEVSFGADERLTERQPA